MQSDSDVREVWTMGSYPDIAPNFLPMAAHLVDVAGVGPDDRVLDVACGTGNVAITAARRGAAVTGFDITPAMLAAARENASIAGVDVDWLEGNATDLPLGTDAFDVTLSCVGHVFARPPEAAAAELVRVTRAGGRLAFVSWTPDSVVAAMAAVLGEYLPPDPDRPEPHFSWGVPGVVEERLSDTVRDLEFVTDTVSMNVPSPGHLWAGASTQSGPFMVALEGVDEADRPALREAMVGAIEAFFDEGTNAVRSEYRLARATVR